MLSLMLFLSVFLLLPFFSKLVELREGINNKLKSLDGFFPSRRFDGKNTSNIFWTQDHQWGTFVKKVIFPL